MTGSPPPGVPAATDCMTKRGERARGGCLMCESRVVLVTPEGEQTVLDDVVSIRPEGDGFLLVNLFGQTAHLRGRIKELDLLKHRLVFEPEA
jgi:predicted RNA-binding protein